MSISSMKIATLIAPCIAILIYVQSSISMPFEMLLIVLQSVILFMYVYHVIALAVPKFIFDYELVFY